MKQSSESEKKKQIEWELILQDALKEVFEPHGHNPCKDIPMEGVGEDLTESSKSLLSRYGVDSKKELFKKLYSYDGESWEDMCERIGEEVSEVAEMDYSELEMRVIATFLMLIEQIRDAHEKHEDTE
jgi:hypothetical protein